MKRDGIVASSGSVGSLATGGSLGVEQACRVPAVYARRSMRLATHRGTPMSARELPEVTVHLPGSGVTGLDQDEEYCVVEVDGRRRRIRFHDYGQVFSVPGLYERLFEEILCCNSPRVVTQLLQDELHTAGRDPRDLSVLDLGAGNGLVGAELAEMGAGPIVGVDLLDEARSAAARDRPGLYDDYLVLDMARSTETALQRLRAHQPDCLTCVAALGFNDVPPRAFANAFNLVSTPGWVAINLQERFLDGADKSGFSALLADMFERGAMVERARLRYRHRLSADGTPLHYVALVAEKQADVAVD